VPFSNPIIGDEELIRSAIKSENFDPGSESTPVAGWRIARDGTATFNNVIIGSPDWVIDSQGNAVFQSVNASEILLDGTSLSETLDLFPRGIIALTTISGTSANYTGASQILAGRIVIPSFDGTRQYVLGGSRLHFDSQAITTIDRMNLDIRINWNAPATTASTLLWAHQERVSNTTAFDQDINFRHPFKSTPPNGNGVDDLHVAVYFASEDTTGLRMEGVTGTRLYVEDIGPEVPYGDFNLGTGTPALQTYVKTYAANWSETFQSDGDGRNISEMYQGYYSGTNGNQYSLCGMPYSTIQTDLSGATVKKVRLYLNNNHFYNNSGGTAIVGTHTYTSEPSSASLSNVSENLASFSFAKGEAKWVTLPNSIGTAFKGGTARGIALGPGPSTSATYYGYFAGNGQSGEPVLEITYEK
jgi:hypothetical protein